VRRALAVPVARNFNYARACRAPRGFSALSGTDPPREVERFRFRAPALRLIDLIGLIGGSRRHRPSLVAGE